MGLKWGHGGENAIIYIKWKIHQSGEWHFILWPWQRWILGLGQQFSSLPNYAMVVLKLHCFIFPRLSPLSGCVARPSVSMLCWRWSPSDWRLERLSHISASVWRLYAVQWTVHCTASVHRPRVPMINSFNFTSFPVDGGQCGQCGQWSRGPALSKLSIVRTVRTAGLYLCISSSLCNNNNSHKLNIKFHPANAVFSSWLCISWMNIIYQYR